MSTTKLRRARTPAVAELGPLEQLLEAMHAVDAGNFSVHLPVHWDGIAGKLAERFNDIVAHNRRLAEDLTRVGDKVGRKGQTRQRLAAANRQGAWAGMEQSVNGLIDAYKRQGRENQIPTLLGQFSPEIQESIRQDRVRPKPKQTASLDPGQTQPSNAR